MVLIFYNYIKYKFKLPLNIFSSAYANIIPHLLNYECIDNDFQNLIKLSHPIEIY